MNEDKKLRHGASPKPQDAALDDNAVEAVTGGVKMTSKARAEKALDKIEQMLDNQKGKEDQP